MSVPELAAWYTDAATASCLEILSEEGFSPQDLLDPETLSAVASASDACDMKFKRTRPLCQEHPRESSPKIENWDDSGDDQDGLDDRYPGRKATKTSANAAARSKACREKARRERINERFVELATLLERGKEPKIDKSSILGDAIKAFQQLLAENNQLRQLNKFLEERVGQLEKAQGQQLYQHAMYQTHQSAQMLHSNHVQPGHSCMQPLVTGVPCMQAGSSLSSAPSAVQHTCELQHNLLQQQLLMQEHRNAATPFSMGVPLSHPTSNLFSSKAVGVGMLNGQDTAAASLRMPYLMSGAPVDPWQDSLLRPPAA